MPKAAKRQSSSARRAEYLPTSSRRPSTRATSSRLENSITIKNSSSQSSDDELNDVHVETDHVSGSSGRRVLKAVAIPTSKTLPRGRISHYSPTASSASLDVSANDSSLEYETPETSAVATPAEISMAKITAESTSTRNPSLTQLRKRKRVLYESDDQLRDDERLAMKLQEEEYTGESISVSRNRRRRIVDSDDDSDLTISDTDSDILSEPETIASLTFLKPKKPLPPTRTTGVNRIGTKLRAKPRSVTVLSSDDEDDGPDRAIPDSSDLDTDFDSLSTDISIDGDGVNTQSDEASNTDPLSTIHHIRRGRRVSRVGTRAEYERSKLEKTHPEIKTLWEDLAKIPKIAPERGEQPKGISRQLKSFQLEGVDWMRKQEQSCWKGGLLGDEMGMGKTIQAVSLIMSDYPAKDPTLVVVPPVALIQWSSEIAAYTDGKLKVLIHHNTDPKVKKLTARDLKKYDVIMISYSGLESIHRKEVKGWKRDEGLVKENSRIHALDYHRLILDEAHSIKSRTTGVAKACFTLRASYKWCLSGTPVQNRIGEFFSLLRFLEVKPFASYFCKQCSCAELHWSQDEEKKCTHCGHSGFSHVSIFNQELLNPLTSATEPHRRKEALAKLRLLTDRIMLRRLKRDHTSSMELPPKEVIIHNEFFGEIERDFSTSIMSNTGRQFDTYVSRGVMLNNYANIFGLIMQMRQVANHPDLILKKHSEGGQNVLVCSICDETAEEPIRSRCNHEFCRKCAKDYIRSFESNLGNSNNVQPDCPRCHIELNIDFDQPDIEQDEDHVKKNSIINRIKMDEWTSSTKIEMLVYDLYKLRKKSQTHKSIVFSQFTSMLQLVEWRLRHAGFNTVMLDGSMSPAQRQKSIEYFMNNVDVEVFLVSLKAGGVALNLTEASRVFIVDPWWNPAAEWQSADRCHRIGQKRPCSITRLCIEDSVESRIVLLQEKKAKMIASTVNNDDVAMEKLTPEDMQFLFRGN